ncbi:calcium binding EF-hand protein precursor [Panicum miliaceum]|uniref:Calcium binding EF-hand protein n=1 Tax=Panicum miliaceum TaxID=4540 RepID=A0A3L6S149_PANMI|nr:calcium binding EF-hand protein precursor [Panicum miliaceum]
MAAGRWPALMPSVLLVWIVCCTWAAQLGAAAASPYGANMTDLMHLVVFFEENKTPGKLPSTNIYVSHINGAVHASDTGAYDKKGNFVPEKFERIFQRFARTEEDALSWLELETMLIANRDPLKPWTWPAAELEWQLIHFLGKDRHGYLHKDTVRGIYDGTVFPKLRDHAIDPHSAHSDA